MTLSEFIKAVDGAPVELERVAEAAREINDNDELQEAGEAFLRAKVCFEMLLDDHGVELG